MALCDKIRAAMDQLLTEIVEDEVRARVAPIERERDAVIYERNRLLSELDGIEKPLEEVR